MQNTNETILWIWNFSILKIWAKTRVTDNRVQNFTNSQFCILTLMLENFGEDYRNTCIVIEQLISATSELLFYNQSYP